MPILLAISSRRDQSNQNSLTKHHLFHLFAQSKIFNSDELVKHCCEFGQHDTLEILLESFDFDTSDEKLKEVYELAIRSECIKTIDLLRKHFQINDRLKDHWSNFQNIAKRSYIRKVRKAFQIQEKVQDSDLIALSKQFGFHDKRVEDKLVRDLDRDSLDHAEIRKHIFDVSCLFSGFSGVIPLDVQRNQNCNW